MISWDTLLLWKSMARRPKLHPRRSLEKESNRQIKRSAPTGHLSAAAVAGAPATDPVWHQGRKIFSRSFSRGPIRPHLWGGPSSFGHSSWEPYRESCLGSLSDLSIAHSTTFVGRAFVLGRFPLFFISKHHLMEKMCEVPVSSLARQLLTAVACTVASVLFLRL